MPLRMVGNVCLVFGNSAKPGMTGGLQDEQQRRDLDRTVNAWTSASRHNPLIKMVGIESKCHEFAP
jgi:hypothetical protein